MAPVETGEAEMLKSNAGIVEVLVVELVVEVVVVVVTLVVVVID